MQKKLYFAFLNFLLIKKEVFQNHMILPDAFKKCTINDTIMQKVLSIKYRLQYYKINFRHLCRIRYVERSNFKETNK